MNRKEYDTITKSVELALLAVACGHCPDDIYSKLDSELSGMIVTRKAKADPHRTAMEYWSAGEVLPRGFGKKPPKGSDCSHWLVRFADGDAINTSVYQTSLEAAKDEAIRSARTRKINRERGPGEYVRLSDGSLRKTSICTIADVVGVEAIQRGQAQAA